MKTAVVLVVVACCAVSALSLAEGVKDSKPPATVSPAQQFGNSTPEPPKPPTTTAKPPTTTAKPTTTPPKPTTTTPKPTTTTPKPTTTTPKPTTTTPKPTTTTPKPTTTTPKPTTTTPKPTTTTPKPTTTTPKPTTTTPKPTTTTPNPTPTPGPTPPTNLTGGNYNVTNDKKEVCLRANMALQIRLESPEANGTFIVQPGQTKATGSCEETKSTLILTFTEGTITFGFNKSVADNSAYVDSLSLNLTYAFVKGKASKNYAASNTSMHLFATKIGHSYSCKSEALYMGNGLYLDVDQDQMQGFNLTKSGDFGSPDVCSADKPDYRVAIGVGVTLLVLIVIVVIAYMVSRKRRTDGYQTL